MRKLVLVGFIALGAATGVFAAFEDGLGLQAVFACVGGVVGAAIGGAVTEVGRSGRRPVTHPRDSDGLEAIQGEQARNYWLDRGRPTPSPGLPHADDVDPHSQEP